MTVTDWQGEEKNDCSENAQTAEVCLTGWERHFVALEMHAGICVGSLYHHRDILRQCRFIVGVSSVYWYWNVLLLQLITPLLSCLEFVMQQDIMVMKMWFSQPHALRWNPCQRYREKDNSDFRILPQKELYHSSCCFFVRWCSPRGSPALSQTVHLSSPVLSPSHRLHLSVWTLSPSLCQLSQPFSSGGSSSTCPLPAVHQRFLSAWQ